MAKFLYELDRLTNNYPIQVARRRIEGAYPYGAIGRRVTTGAYSGILWPDGSFAFPSSSGSTVSVVSTSANDTAGGTGVQSIKFRYLDVDLIEHTETIVLNGTTPVVSTATNVRYVNGMVAASLGSGKAAAGAITLYSGTGNHTYIAAGSIRCTCTVRTVPANSRFIITSLQAGAVSGTSASSVEVQLAVSSYLDIDYSSLNILFPYMAFAQQDNSSSISLDAPVAFTEGISIGMLCSCDKAATIVGSYHGWIEPI